MSLLRDFQFREVSSFGGPWLLPDPSMVDVRGALLARNVEYSAGQVGTRLGFGAISWGTTTVYTTSQMYAWYAPFSSLASALPGAGDAALATFSVAGFGAVPGVQTVNLKSKDPILTFQAPSAAVGATFVGVGLRLYAAYHDTGQRGLFAAGGGYGTAFNVFPASVAGSLFPGPWRNLAGPVFAVAAGAAGVVTAGTHRYGFILEYASGFTSRVSPDSGATSPPSITSFVPFSVVAAGATMMTATVTPSAAPDGDVVAFSVVMTTTSDLNQYYIVPGSRTALAAAPVSYSINISDADLASQGIDATPYLYWLTCDSNNANNSSLSATVPPFSPSHMCLFGDRMAYKGYQKDNKGSSIDCLYVSERNNYQAITADQHLVMLPGQRNITTMFRMGGNNYIVGPHEIYSTADTGDVPATWPAPHLVDGRTGTLAIHGVEVAPSGQYAWIADQAGLFLFTGSPITSLPVSYYQSSDWGRINWDVAYVVQIRDDAGKKLVHLLVALDGATTPTHIMTFDYTDGASYLSVRYSLDNLSGYNIGAIELVQNDLSSQATGNQKGIELWLGPRTGTTYLRRASAVDTTPYRDNAAAINSVYRTCPLPGRDQTQGLIQQHHGFHARIRGSGTITPKLYDIDAVRSFTCRTLTMSTTPDADQLFMADLRGELSFVEMATNTLDTYWRLAYLKAYASPYIIQR